MSLPDALNCPGLAAGPRKKSSNGRLIQRFFSRQSNNTRKSPLAQVEPGLPEPHRRSSSNDDIRVMPCPYIYPLTSDKLEPRTERAPLGPRRSQAGSSTTALCLRGRPSRDACCPPPVTSAADCLDEGSVGADTTSLLNLRIRADIAATAALDASHLKEWSHYVKSYSEGRFNLILPPDPPPRNPSFRYLPSTYPTNEVDRLFTAKMCLLEWSKPTRKRAKQLILEVMDAFHSPCASLSIFNRDTEIIQVEYGYGRTRIPRSESISSHVLLTNEVMAVLDTRNDWRFAGNPLVVKDPKIRFFAGAPLLSSNSEVVGVLAIFGPEPRTGFTAMQRRELTNYCATAVKDLTSLWDVNYDESLRSTPILRRESPIDSRLRLSRDWPFCYERGGLESGLIPPALRYHKCTEPMKSNTRVIINRGSGGTHSSVQEQTPPNSDDSDSRFSPKHKGFGKNHKQLSLNTSSLQSNCGEITPDSPTCGYQSLDFSHRPFSGSDLTSVDNVPHPCTPESGYNPIGRGSSITAEDFSTFFNQFEDTTGSDVGNHSSQSLDSPELTRLYEETPLLSHDRRFQIVMDDEGLVLSTDLLTSNPYQTSRHDSATIDSASTDNSGNNQAVSPQTEAKFAAEFWAKNLGFDAVYAVELRPRKPFMTDAELKSPGGMRIRILISYGLVDGVDVDVPIHLQALRARDAITYENDSGDGYSRGFMMSMVPEQAFKQSRSRGVVFGAFRKAPKDGSVLPNLSSTEIDRLSNACGVLKNILYKPNASECPSRSQSEPPSSPSAYPANEAIELGKFSLDAGKRQVANRRKRINRQPLPSLLS